MGQDLTIDIPRLARQRDSAAARASATQRATLVAEDWRAFTSPEQIARWDALATRADEPNPFYESWSLLPALEQFDPAGRVELWVLEADGDLIGLIPMARETRYYGYPLPHWRNWTHANCFFGAPLVARGFESVFWSLLLDRTDRVAGFSLFLHLTHLSATGPIHIALLDALQKERSRRPAATVMRETRAALVSRAPPEAYYREALTTRKRKELRRQRRRLEEQGTLAVERRYDGEGLPQWIEDFLALEQRGWKGETHSALACDPRTARMFSRTLEGAARRGRLERLSLTLDGKPIAMLANLLTPPGAFSYKTSFDEDYARFSPGVLLQRENLDLLDRDEIEWADSCAAQDHPMIGHFWRERRAIARHSIGIGGAPRRKLFAAIARMETGQPASGIS